MDINGLTEIKDFSRPIEPHPFRINEDIFSIIPSIPLGLVSDVMSAVRNVRTDGTNDLKGQMDALEVVFKILLTDDCVDKFVARLSSKLAPIDQHQLMDIVTWALEKYGLRPTQPSETSSLGSGDQETSTLSTDGLALTAAPDGSIGQPGDPSTSSTSTSES